MYKIYVKPRFVIYSPRQAPACCCPQSKLPTALPRSGVSGGNRAGLLGIGCGKLDWIGLGLGWALLLESDPPAPGARRPAPGTRHLTSATPARAPSQFTEFTEFTDRSRRCGSTRDQRTDACAHRNRRQVRRGGRPPVGHRGCHWSW